MPCHVLPTDPVVAADENLTAGEIAALTIVAEKTVHSTAENSEPHSFKVRGQWRYRRHDLDSWMASRTKGPGALEQEGTKRMASTRKGGTRR